MSHRGAAGLCRFEGIEPGFIEITTLDSALRRGLITVDRISRRWPDIMKRAEYVVETIRRALERNS